MEMEDIQTVREQFPITRSKTFLNHAAQTPPPKPVLEAMRSHMEEFSESGTYSVDPNEIRRTFAQLIDAKPEEVAFVPNTSTGLNIVANMLEYPSESNIVTTDLEFPSVVYPWLRKRLGVEVRYVKNVNGKVLISDVERAVDDKTVALVVSHVEYTNGFRHNLGELAQIAHEHGAYLVVDVIQSAGAIQINLKRDDVDFATASCYKWLLGPDGVGFLYVREDLIEEFEPPFVGWASVKHEVFETLGFWDIWSLKLSETASRFEVGSLSVASFVGAAAAIKLLLRVGITNVERRILTLTDHLISGLKELGLRLQTPEEKECRSGIVNFIVPNPERKMKELREKGVIVSARAMGIRVSPHFYNTEEEIDRLLAELHE